MNLGRTSSTSTQCVLGIIAQSFAGSSILMGDLFLKVSTAAFLVILGDVPSKVRHVCFLNYSTSTPSSALPMMQLVSLLYLPQLLRCLSWLFHVEEAVLRREILKTSRATFWPEVNRLTPSQELYATRELLDLRTASKHSIEALPCLKCYTESWSVT